MIGAILNMALSVMGFEMKFKQSIQGGLTECLMQNIQPGIKAVFKARADAGAKVMIMINNPQGRELDRQLGSGELKSEIEASVEG